MLKKKTKNKTWISFDSFIKEFGPKWDVEKCVFQHFQKKLTSEVVILFLIY